MLLNTLIAQLSEWMGAIAVAWLFSLSPRLKRPPVGFKYARRDGITALMLFALILVLAFVLYTVNAPVIGPVTRLAPAPAPVSAPQPADYLTRALLAAGLALAAFVVAVVARKQPVRSTGWNIQVGTSGQEDEAPTPAGRKAVARNPAGRPAGRFPAARRSSGGIFGPALQMGFAIAILTIFLRNRVMDVLAGLKPGSLTILLLALLISLAEETVFRGYIQLRLSWWLGKWAGLVLTAALFTLWHVPEWLSQAALETKLILAGLTFAQGLVLGWIMQQSKNVIAPALYRSISIWMNFLG